MKFLCSDKLVFSLLLSAFLVFPFVVFAQNSFLKIATPVKDSSTVTNQHVFFSGLAKSGSKLWLNDAEVKVYGTGAFAHPIALQSGRNEFIVLYIFEKDTLRRKLIINYLKIPQMQPVKGFAIEYIKLLQDNDLWLQPGEKLQIEMKATPGKLAFFNNGVRMFEADSASTGIRGIYRGEYQLQLSDTVKQQLHISGMLYDPVTKKSVKANAQQALTIINPNRTLIGVTTGERPYMNFSMGEDRLGATKMGYLDSLIKLEVTGKVGNNYRVRLSDNKQAYIPQRNLHLLDGVNFRPQSITDSWSVGNDGKADFVIVRLDERLPYSSFQEINPARIVVDVYGAVSNTNWITQKQGLKAIQNVWYEQLSKDVFRVYIELQKRQHWGYDIYYRGRSLTIKVKSQPASLDLANLSIGVDAGHGGSNTGADGLAGSLEKNITLAIALKLQAELKKNGARVIMTRERDTTFNNSDRIAWMKQQNPDLLVSIHCNSGNPLAQGTSTYYKHISYRPLSQFIYEELLKLGLKEFGNVGSFNFFFNTPTEYPTVLVETDFISNPEMEEKLLNDPFQQRMAESMVLGIKRFLAGLTPDVVAPEPEESKPNKKRNKKG